MDDPAKSRSKEAIRLQKSIRRWEALRPCVGYSVLCGALTGVTVFGFKMLAGKLETVSQHLYETAARSPLGWLLVFVVLAVLVTVMLWGNRVAPEARGGGIPMSTGILRGELRFRWLRTLLWTVAGSVISFFSGIPVGCEGPSVLVGTALGRFCVGRSRHRTAWERYVMTGGAGAGFAVATGAPLSGVLFALEEIHKRFTPMLVLSTSLAVVSATCVNRGLCALWQLDPRLLPVNIETGLSFSESGYLLLLGLIVSLTVGLFDALVALWGTLTEKYGRVFSGPAKLLLTFALTGLLGLCLEEGVHGGHHTILDAIQGNRSVVLLFGLLVVRVVMMLLVTDSGATGGIFVPTLVIGALVGKLTAKLLVALGLSPALVPAVVLLGMCAFIGGTLRAPLTAIALFAELTGQVSDLFAVALVIFAVNLATEIFNRPGFYDRVLETLKREQRAGRQTVVSRFRLTVSPDAFVAGKTVRDVMWPSGTMVLSVIRGDLSPVSSSGGERQLYAGDTVIVRAKYWDEAELMEQLGGLVGTDHDIVAVPD